MSNGTLAHRRGHLPGGRGHRGDARRARGHSAGPLARGHTCRVQTWRILLSPDHVYSDQRSAFPDRVAVPVALTLKTDPGWQDRSKVVRVSNVPRKWRERY